ncbi:MAG TPA: ELWxxDGT repeat protein [Roseiflexaceae bacterium]|jgi:ELWxxDGT repeat protein
MKCSTKLPVGWFAARRTALLACLIGLLALALAPAARADGPAFLVRDINTRPFEEHMSNPSNLIAVGNTIYFLAETQKTGPELWRTDGTDAGTRLVKDIAPGSEGAFVYGPARMANVDGTLFFTADEGAISGELWKSDGTDAGTVPVKSRAISPGYPLASLTSVGETLFFLAESVASGSQLWKSDGTDAGTVPLTLTGGYSNPSSLLNVAGTLFFVAYGNGGRAALWKSDGTAAGTLFVKAIGEPVPVLLTDVNGTLFFAANDGHSGYELWKSDGTTAGTVQVKDIHPGPNSSDPTNLTGVNGTLFFVADDGSSGYELWRSDGTDAGTKRVIDLILGPHGSRPAGLANVNGALFFAGTDGSSGYEIWRSDGTAAGTRLIADIASGSLSSSPRSFTLAGNYLFFSADDGNTGQELWAIRSGVDAYLQTPVLTGAAPGGAAGIPIRYGNLGLTGADALTLTAALDPALSYVGDSSGITPTISGKTVSWRLPPVDFNGRGDFTVWVHAPSVAFGARYPIVLTLTTASETHPPDNIAQVQVMIAHQVYLPVVQR